MDSQHSIRSSLSLLRPTACAIGGNTKGFLAPPLLTIIPTYDMTLKSGLEPPFNSPTVGFSTVLDNKWTYPENMPLVENLTRKLAELPRNSGSRAPPNSPALGFFNAFDQAFDEAFDRKRTYSAVITPLCPRIEDCTVFANNNWDGDDLDDDHEQIPTIQLRRQVRSTNLAALVQDSVDEAAEAGYSSPSSGSCRPPNLHVFDAIDSDNEGNGTCSEDSEIVGTPQKTSKFFL